MTTQDNNNDSGTPNLDLGAIREQIDAIDLQIQSLLEQRAQAALQVATVKLNAAQGAPVDFYRPEREAQILKAVAARNDGPMSDVAVQKIFRGNHLSQSRFRRANESWLLGARRHLYPCCSR